MLIERNLLEIQVYIACLKWSIKIDLNPLQIANHRPISISIFMIWSWFRRMASNVSCQTNSKTTGKPCLKIHDFSIGLELRIIKNILKCISLFSYTLTYTDIKICAYDSIFSSNGFLIWILLQGIIATLGAVNTFTRGQKSEKNILAFNVL